MFSSQVRIMRKRLVRKVFDMIDDIAARENKEVRRRQGGWLGADEHAWPDLDFSDWKHTALANGNITWGLCIDLMVCS